MSIWGGFVWFAYVLGVTGLSLDDLDTYIEKGMATAHMPSLSAAVIHNSTVLWKKAYGMADPFTNRKATVDTPYLLASISKTVTATTLMQLYDQGLFDLDDDINTYLNKYPKAGFEVVNPHFPNDQITFRLLMTHTSSISDDGMNNMPDNYVYTRGKDSPVALRDFLYSYFNKKGRYYSKQNFKRHQPGSYWEYCNVGAALAGYMVEALTSEDFAVRSTEHVLKPLGFHVPTFSNWHLDPMNQSTLAFPTAWNKRKNTHQKYCQYTFPDYPDGNLRATASDIALHLSAFIQFGQTSNGRVLNQSTVVEMRKKVNITTRGETLPRTQALFWYYEKVGGRDVLGHEGGEQGVATVAFFNPDTNVGVVMLVNSDWEQSAKFDQTYYAMEAKLFETFETHLFESGEISVNPEVYRDASTSDLPAYQALRRSRRRSRKVSKNGDLCDY